MFATRLNPTKPSAGHRAVLERVGAACRELRPIEEARCHEHRLDDQIAGVFAKHGVLGVGIAPEHGGLGTEPLLCAMTAERIGREGQTPGNYFASHFAGVATLGAWGSDEQRSHYLARAARGECVVSVALPVVQAARLPTQPGGPPVATTMHPSRAESAAGRARTVIAFSHDGSDGSESAFIVDTEPATGSLLGGHGQGPDVALTARLCVRLSTAAASVGMIADCLETLCDHVAQRLGGDLAAPVQSRIEQYVARTAVDLEAVRALVYASAERKAEYDRRPTSAHLQHETETLVCEASYLASRAAERLVLHAAEIELGGSPLSTCLPARHQLVPHAAAIGDESPESLEQIIARYYLSCDDS